MQRRTLLSLVASAMLTTLAGAFGHSETPYKTKGHTYKSGNSAFQKGAKAKSHKTRSNRQKAKAKK